MNKKSFGLSIFLAGAMTLPALAHPGHPHHADWAGGMAHPFSGLDHLLAMLAVGLWAGQLRGRSIWALPAAFLGGMIVGGCLGMAGLHAPALESGIAASVLALGLLIAAGARTPLSGALPAVFAFALLHGLAHGSELPMGANAATYALGFLASTAILHVGGVALALGLTGRRKSNLIRWSGAAIACAGLMMVVGAF